ncbi:MAG: c-type cytochrome [Gemmatimonadota bacterium]
MRFWNPSTGIISVVRRSALAALGWTVLAAGQMLAAQEASSFPGNPIAGRHIFAERACQRCHSIWGNGGALGPDFALVGAGRSLEQLAGLFWNHTPRMFEAARELGYEWPTFTQDELAHLISYVYYVKLFDKPGDPEVGEQLFRDRRCARCHTIGGTGAGDVGGPLDNYARYAAAVMLAQGMWNHGPTMRRRQVERGISLPTFSGNDISDLQAYLRRASSLRDREMIFLEPPDPNAGQRLFASKGCRDCHGNDGSGSEFAPNLREAVQRLGVSEIAGELWNHSAGMAAEMSARGIVFPRFEGTEMADIITYLYYLRFYETGGDPAEGELVFARKGCVACHAGVGRPALGPDLSRSETTRTLLGLATEMWNHAPAMYGLMEPANVDWPRFEGDEMRDLAAYLKLFAGSAAPALEGES